MAKFKVKKSKQSHRKENHNEKKEINVDKEKKKFKKELQKSKLGLVKWMLVSSLVVVVIGIAIVLCQELFETKRTIITQPPMFKVILPTEKLQSDTQDPSAVSKSSASHAEPKESATNLYNELELDAEKVQREFNMFEDAKWTEKSNLENGYQAQKHKSSILQKMKSVEDTADEIKEPLNDDQGSIGIDGTDMTNKITESLDDDKEAVGIESSDITDDDHISLDDNRSNNILNNQKDDKLSNSPIFSGKANQENDLEDVTNSLAEDGTADLSTETHLQDRPKSVKEDIKESLRSGLKKTDSSEEMNNVIENNEKLIFFDEEAKTLDDASTENNEQATSKENYKNYEEGNKNINLDREEKKLHIEEKNKDEKYEDASLHEDEENGGLRGLKDKTEQKKSTTSKKQKDLDITKEDKNEKKEQTTNQEMTGKDKNSLEDEINDQKRLKSNKTFFQGDSLSIDNGAQNHSKLSAIEAKEEIRKQESLPLEDENDEENNIDIINNKLREEDYDSDEFDEPEYKQFSDLNDEKPYHVEEKRIKIVKDSDYVPISDGLKKHILREGYGNVAKKGEQVTLHCMGFLDKTPPKMFWNTKELGQRPFSFIAGEKQVIKGWDEAALTMKMREKSKFKIEAKKAYGKFGFAAWDIPPNADLIMEFEMIAIKPVKSKKITRLLK